MIGTTQSPEKLLRSKRYLRSLQRIHTPCWLLTPSTPHFIPPFPHSLQPHRQLHPGMSWTFIEYLKLYCHIETYYHITTLKPIHHHISSLKPIHHHISSLKPMLSSLNLDIIIESYLSSYNIRETSITYSEPRQQAVCPASVHVLLGRRQTELIQDALLPITETTTVVAVITRQTPLPYYEG